MQITYSLSNNHTLEPKPVYILAIESSCDETSAAVLKDTHVLSNIVASQTVHTNFGGVVPELASRAHLQKIIPVVRNSLSKANIDKNDLHAIAFTRGPGLMGSLLVGVSFAKALALSLNIPLIEVNHMQAHVLAHFICGTDSKTPPTFPFLCLTVSGGHTQIVLVEDFLEMKIIGETLDDAAGEAFDKAAKVLGLPYPGGPLIDHHARKGDPYKFKFPFPDVPGYDYSFSGFKTSVLYFVRDQLRVESDFIGKNLSDICASIQFTIVKILLHKLKAAIEDTGIKQVALAGGVSANTHLRKEFKKLEAFGVETFIPPFEYCTDNAAMIGIAGYFKYLNNDFSNHSVVPIAKHYF